MKGRGPRPYSATRLIVTRSLRSTPRSGGRRAAERISLVTLTFAPGSWHPAGCLPPSNREDVWTSASPRPCRFDVTPQTIRHRY